MIRKLLALLCLLVPAAAQADWYEATSPNFIVYSENSRSDATEFAAKLERFHYVLRTFHSIDPSREQNPMRVFLFSSGAKVGRMIGASSAAGYYVPDARGLMLVGTRAAATRRGRGDLRSAGSTGDAPLDSESILLHEYVHHFMRQYFPATYPTWYSEGYAEFWGTTRFLPGDVVEVGLPAEHRFQTLQILGWMPLERLLTAHNYGEVRGENIFLLYAQGWLVVRYGFSHPERQRQLNEYLRLINQGSTYEEAMRQAIPDLDRFNSELFNYAGSGRFEAVRLPFRTIDVGEIEVRALRPAEEALIEHEIKLSQGYPQHEAEDFAREVRSIASRYSDDPFALSVLMEAERLAGKNEAAIAAAERLLTADPRNARAMATRGLAQVAGLRAAGSADAAAWQAVQQSLARAAALAPRDPVVLAAYHESYSMRGVLPPPEAQNALYDAMELAPSDAELRYRLARDFELRDMIPQAIAIIRPQAMQTPHRGDESDAERRRREEREERERQAGRERRETAREMLARLEAQLAGGAAPAQAAARDDD